MFGAKEIKKNSKDLVEAGFDGELDEIKTFVDKGFHIDSEDGRSHTALSEAAAQGHNHVITWLLEQGAVSEEKIGKKGKEGKRRERKSASVASGDRLLHLFLIWLCHIHALSFLSRPFPCMSIPLCFACSPPSNKIPSATPPHRTQTSATITADRPCTERPSTVTTIP